LTALLHCPEREGGERGTQGTQEEKGPPKTLVKNDIRRGGRTRNSAGTILEESSGSKGVKKKRGPTSAFSGGEGGRNPVVSKYHTGRKGEENCRKDGDEKNRVFMEKR